MQDAEQQKMNRNTAGAGKTSMAKKIAGTFVPAFFLLFLEEWQIAGISVRTLLIYLYTFIVGGFWIREKKTRKWNMLDSLLGFFLVWNLFYFAAELIRGTGSGARQLLMIALVLLFYFSSTEKEQAVSTNCMLVCATFGFMGLFWHFLVDKNYSFNLQSLLKNEEALASFLILTCVIATAEYCREEDQVQRQFYFVIALAGYFLLFASCNIMAIVITGLFFPLFLLVQEIDKTLVKRVMQMAFLYFFLLANMPLLTFYVPTDWAGKFYSLENGVYLELVVAVAAVVFLFWWDRFPTDEAWYLSCFRDGIKWITAGIFMLLFLLLVMGGRLGKMEGTTGVMLLGQLAASMRQYCSKHNGMFLDVLEQYGIPGGIWLSGVILAIVKRMRRQIRKKRISPMLLVLFILFSLQSVFMSLQPVTAPLYVLLAAQALYGGEKEICVRNSGEELYIYEEFDEEQTI